MELKKINRLIDNENTCSFAKEGKSCGGTNSLIVPGLVTYCTFGILYL